MKPKFPSLKDWGQVAIRRDSDCAELARQIRDKIEDSYYMANS